MTNAVFPRTLGHLTGIHIRIRWENDRMIHNLVLVPDFKLKEGLAVRVDPFTSLPHSEILRWRRHAWSHRHTPSSHSSQLQDCPRMKWFAIFLQHVRICFENYGHPSDAGSSRFSRFSISLLCPTLDYIRAVHGVDHTTSIESNATSVLHTRRHKKKVPLLSNRSKSQYQHNSKIYS